MPRNEIENCLNPGWPVSSQNVYAQQIEGKQGANVKLSEFSKLTGIAESTLVQYHELGLLSARVCTSGCEPGYTRYHLIQLERIAFMNLLGMSLQQIRNALGAEVDVAQELHFQQTIVEQLRKRLRHLTYFLQIAEEINSSRIAEDWHYMGKAIDFLEQLRRLDTFGRREVDQLSGGHSNFHLEDPLHPPNDESVLANQNVHCSSRFRAGCHCTE